MNELRKRMEESPEFARVAPFVIFVVLTAGQGWFGEPSRYWMYLVKTLAGAWLVWEMRRVVPEVRWAFSWEAVAVGIAIFVVWVGLDPFVPKNTMFFKPSAMWNPNDQFGEGSALAWFYIVVRILGSSIIVPPIEETFYRSFLYRYIIKYDFQKVALGHFDGVAFVIVAFLFGGMHFEWLAGIICGLAYQWLVVRKGRLGDAMLAHGITNFLLGVWIVWKNAWGFW